MPTQTEEVEGGYRFLAVALFLFIAFPLAAYTLMPDNYYANFISFPARMLLVPIHEFGHNIVSFFTEFSGLPFSSMYLPITMAGSLFEVFLPFLVALLFIFGNRRYAIACLIIVILGAAFYDFGTYVRSAESPSGPAINSLMQPARVTPETHDWFIVLSAFNELDKAGVISQVLMDLGFVITLVGFFSSVFELNLVINYRKSSDFMLLLLYGSAITLLLLPFYFTLFKLIFLLLISISLLIHFKRSVLPHIKKEIEEVDKEIEKEEDEQESKTEKGEPYGKAEDWWAPPDRKDSPR